MNTLNSYTLPQDIPRNEIAAQTFLSDPQKLLILREDQLNHFIRSLSRLGSMALFIHGSYLLSDLGKGYQRKLLRQETTIANTIGARVYILHLPAKHKDIDQFIRDHQILKSERTALAFENTSVRVNKSYIQSLIGRDLVVDTSHLFCSGLVRNAEAALALIKTLNRTSNILAIHMNDQAGAFNSGKDVHCAIGTGNLFGCDPPSLKLFWYIVTKFTVVLEYSQQGLNPHHTETIRAYRSNTFTANTDVLLRAAILSQQLTTASSNQFQKQVYSAYESAFIEIAGKERQITLERARVYGLPDKADSILIYASVIPPSQQYTNTQKQTHIPLVVGIRYYNKIAGIMGATPDRECFVAGSIRREKALVGDIDIVLLAEYERQCIGKLASAGFLPSSVVEQQDRVIYRFNIRVTDSGEYKSIQVDLHICDRADLACTMLYLTGSKYFNLRMRRHARTIGYKLSNRHISTLKNNKRLPIRSEKDVFDLLNMKYILPRFRVM